MFNKVRENVYIRKFLELWNIPRYRSLLILGLYAIFFMIIIASIKTKNDFSDYSTTQKDAMEEYRIMDNYEYIATITNEDTKILIGKVYKEKQIILFDNDNYYFDGVMYKKDDSYIKIEDKLLEFDVWKMTPLFISNLVEKGSLDYKTEYSDETISKTYKIDIKEFIKLYFSDDTDSSNTYISVTIYENQTRVTKVELDLSSIYHMKQYANAYDYKITLEYDSINALAPIVVDLESSD